jgi:hypothetical protein
MEGADIKGLLGGGDNAKYYGIETKLRGHFQDP